MNDVKTNVGYGNCSPSTTEGRAMVFTFGFLCILIFGAVLAKAGDIITTIFDDLVQRHRRLNWLSISWVAMLFWGVLFYVWLFVIAVATVEWKEPRVGQDMKW